MAKKFSALVASTMSPEAIERARKATQTTREALPLNELRRARDLSHKVLAAVLNIEQPALLKMERRADMYISTLRYHNEAMGGALEIIARFPDGAIKIQTFEISDRVESSALLRSVLHKGVAHILCKSKKNPCHRNITLRFSSRRLHFLKAQIDLNRPIDYLRIKDVSFSVCVRADETDFERSCVGA